MESSTKDKNNGGRNFKLYIIAGVSLLILATLLVGGYLFYVSVQAEKEEAEKVSVTITNNSEIYQPLIQSSKGYEDKFTDETDASDYIGSSEKYGEFLEKLNQLNVENEALLESYTKAKEAEVLRSPNEETKEYGDKVEVYINEGVEYYTTTGEVLDFYICVAEKDRNLFSLSEEMERFDTLDTSSKSTVINQLRDMQATFTSFGSGISEYKNCFQGEYEEYSDEEVIAEIDEMAGLVNGMSSDIDDMINALNANDVAGVQDASMRINEKSLDLQVGQADRSIVEKHVAESGNRKVGNAYKDYREALSELKKSEDSLEDTYNLEIVVD
jgi:hypothetical protein